jgi:hypothetical protein
MTDWLTLRHEETSGETQVPADLSDADLEFYAARGWHPVDDGAGDGNAPGVPPAPDVDPNAGEWVELVHPLLAARHSFPNNEGALQGAADAGWVAPKKDGGVPAAARRKAARDAGVDVDDLPDGTAPVDPADEQPAPEPAGGPAAGETAPTKAGESAAPDTEELNRG